MDDSNKTDFNNGECVNVKVEMVDDDLEYVKVDYVIDDFEYVFDLVNEDRDGDGEDEDIASAFDDVRIIETSSQAMEFIDIVKQNILPRLPAKTLARFRAVSKEWNAWICSPFLAHQQSFYFKNLSGFLCQSESTKLTFVPFDQSAFGFPTPVSFLPEDATLLSSCNGLLLLRCRSCHYVCNPVTRDFTILPSPTFLPGDEATVVLAFDPSALNIAANYSVVRVVPFFKCVYFDIYSSETGTWELSETTAVDDDDDDSTSSGYSSFYMNKIVYIETTTRRVIAFDIFSGLLQDFSLPLGSTSDGVVTGMRGELCYVRVKRVIENEFLLKIHSGMELDLRRVVRVVMGPEEEASYRVLRGVDGDNVMVMIGGKVIYCCNTSDWSVEEVCRVENGHGSEWFPYINTMVSVAKNPC